MRFHTEPMVDLNDFHPEDPRRIHVIFEELVDADLAYSDDPMSRDPPQQPSEFHMVRINVRAASFGEITLVHTPEHFHMIKSLEGE